MQHKGSYSRFQSWKDPFKSTDVGIPANSIHGHSYLLKLSTGREFMTVPLSNFFLGPSKLSSLPKSSPSSDRAGTCLQDRVIYCFGPRSCPFWLESLCESKKEWNKLLTVYTHGPFWIWNKIWLNLTDHWGMYTWLWTTAGPEPVMARGQAPFRTHLSSPFTELPY